MKQPGRHQSLAALLHSAFPSGLTPLVPAPKAFTDTASRQAPSQSRLAAFGSLCGQSDPHAADACNLAGHMIDLQRTPEPASPRVQLQAGGKQLQQDGALAVPEFSSHAADVRRVSSQKGLFQRSSELSSGSPLGQGCASPSKRLVVNSHNGNANRISLTTKGSRVAMVPGAVHGQRSTASGCGPNKSGKAVRRRQQSLETSGTIMEEAPKASSPQQQFTCRAARILQSRSGMQSSHDPASAVAKREAVLVEDCVGAPQLPGFGKVEGIKLPFSGLIGSQPQQPQQGVLYRRRPGSCRWCFSPRVVKTPQSGPQTMLGGGRRPMSAPLPGGTPSAVMQEAKGFSRAERVAAEVMRDAFLCEAGLDLSRSVKQSLLFPEMLRLGVQRCTTVR